MSRYDTLMGLLGKGMSEGAASADKADAQKAEMERLIKGKQLDEQAHDSRFNRNMGAIQQLLGAKSPEEAGQMMMDRGGSFGMNESGISVGADPQMRMQQQQLNAQRRDAGQLNAAYKPVQAAHEAMAKQAENVQALLSGSATGEQIAAAAKAMIVHNGGQVPQGLIKAFGGEHGSKPGEVAALLNNITGDMAAQMTPAQRKALGDELIRDLDRQHTQAQTLQQRFEAGAAGLAPSMAQAGTLMQQVGTYKPSTYEEAYKGAKDSYGKWSSNQQASLPGPGQSMGLGERAHQTAGKAVSGLGDFFRGLIKGPQSAPAASRAASPVAPGVAPQAASGGGLTPQEQAELEQLRKEMGR